MKTISKEGLDVKDRNETFSPLKWNFLIFTCTVGYSSYSILVNLSKVDNQLMYSSAFLYLLIEMVKLATSLAFWTMESKTTSLPTSLTPSAMHTSTKLWYALSFCVPALLYCSTNNIAVHLQLQMDPATYQILGNLKILSTAILYRIIIKRVLAFNQWIALFILFLSACLNGLGGLSVTPPSASPAASSDTETTYQSTFVTPKGLLGIIAYTMMSGMAGVYNECILKEHKQVSINVQNSLLYTYGIFFNAAVWLYNRDAEKGLFEGFNVYVVLIVLTQSFIGLVMSLVMKYSSNISKLFIVSSSALLTTLLSFFLLHITVGTYFVLSLSLFVFSLYLYYKA